MTKSELLKIKDGTYLLTDNICNYTYIMRKSGKDGHIAIIYNTLSKAGSVHIHYGLIQSFDDEYDRYVPFKRMDCSASVGGISVSQKGSYNIISELNLVGIYREGKVSEDIKRFITNYRIGLSKYDKKQFRKYTR